MSFLEKRTIIDRRKISDYPIGKSYKNISSMFYNPAFYPKAVGYKLTRQVFWLVLLNCILPKLLQWICAIRC